MKYKLINKKSCSKNGVLREGESCRFHNNCIYPNCCETICDKVTIDGFDYYMSDEKMLNGDYCVHPTTLNISQHSFDNNLRLYWKKVIATNNPNIDIPKVVDEVERLAKEYAKGEEVVPFHTRKGFIAGYNKSQETYSFSEEDMIEFCEWLQIMNLGKENPTKPTKEIIQLWKEQKPKIVYYE